MDELLSRVYALTAQRVPMIADQITPPPGVDSFPATLMADVDWMAERVRDTGRRWGSCDPRVNGTLWWYSASSILTCLPVATALVTGIAADPRLEGASCFLRDDGYLGGIVAASTVPVPELAGELRCALSALIDALADASGVRRQALWAITTDSVSNRALDACADRLRGSAFAEGLIEEMCTAGAAMPRARFVDVQAGGASRRFTQRASCCLIYETRGSGMCVSCPRRAPDDRIAGLSKLVI